MKMPHLLLVLGLLVGAFFLGILFEKESTRYLQDKESINAYIRIIPTKEWYTLEKYGTSIPVFLQNEEITQANTIK